MVALTGAIDPGSTWAASTSSAGISLVVGLATGIVALVLTSSPRLEAGGFQPH
jgi:hypothetical protein